ncbi:unnamed protein product [Thelazia callipaeda]|uniref:E5 n=1 Tax=Thelazia callipaeda TaxID=103827 RepID=A0A0N5D1U1_THECL|nr:unnamed protein product [Thelazia callipaeda]
MPGTASLITLVQLAAPVLIHLLIAVTVDGLIFLIIYLDIQWNYICLIIKLLQSADQITFILRILQHCY